MRFGFIGNHPFSTRFFCSKSSPIAHKEEAPMIPRMEEAITFSTVMAKHTAKIPPTIIFWFNDDWMEDSDDQKCTDGDDDTGEMQFHKILLIEK